MCRFPALLLLVALSALAQGLDQRQLDRIPAAMKAFVDARVVAGSVELVARHGKIALLDAQGMADIEDNKPMRKDTMFQIMSMTKPFTAVGIMMLAEEGKLTLRDPVERFLPEFRNQRVAATTGPNNGPAGTPSHPITIRELMTHTSGLFDVSPFEIQGYSQKMDTPLADLVKVYARQPLLFQPGTKWSYSSPGIDVLGRVIEVCSGEKYEDFITSRILKPLGMKDSTFYLSAAQIERDAMVYEWHDGKLSRSPGTILGGDPTMHRKGAVYPAPSWGLYSTAEDLFRFYEMMLEGGTLNGHRYLSKFSVDLMTQVHTGQIPDSGWLGGGAYGLAWEVVKDSEGASAGHSLGTFGHGGAFGTQGWIDPKHDLIRILLIQRSNGGTNSMRDTFQTMAEAAVN